MHRGISISSSGIKTKLGIRPLTIDDRDLPEEEGPDDVPRKKHEESDGCCGSEKQIFWYRSMGSSDFGIHIDIDAFYSFLEGKPGKRPILFRKGLLHEYFHHIVDSWCVINEVERTELGEQREKQYLREKYLGEPLLMLEESMANQFAAKWGGDEVNDFVPKSGPYSMWEPFNSPEVWLSGSIVVALQYVHGSFMINGLVPSSGFTNEILERFKVPEEWVRECSEFKKFTREGKDFGFPDHYENGVWSIQEIPLIIHSNRVSRRQEWADRNRHSALEYIKRLDSDEEE